MDKTDLPHVVVFGSHTFADFGLLCRKLDHYCSELGKIVVVHGHCSSGADVLAESWAIGRKHSVTRFPADWEQFGKRAGPLRNQDMVDYLLEISDRFAVAFWDGKSRGTRDMIERVRKAGIELKIIRFGS